MIYLVVPVVCFALLAGLIWVLWADAVHVRTWKRKIDDIDVFLSVLMTAGTVDSYLILRVPRRVTWLKMTFRGSVVRLELPLITRLQKSRREKYLSILRDIGLDARITSDSGEYDALEWKVEGPPAGAATVIKDAFVELFEVEITRTLEILVFAHMWDQNVIDQALRGDSPPDKVKLPVAATQGQQADIAHQPRAGCMKVSASLLLMPLPFMIAYIEFGYLVATAVLVAIFISREAYRRWKKTIIGFQRLDLIKIIVPALSGATIYFNDPLYLQLIPTIVLALVAFVELFFISFNLPPLLEWNRPLPRRGRLLFSFAIIASCIGGAALNEYLRTNITLDAWIWFFAFVRIELFLGFSTAMIPFSIYMARNIQSPVGESEQG
jgi:intracellular septation protein A